MVTAVSFSLSSQLTVERLCKLKPLHSGLSPAVLTDLHWSEISEDALCQCWRTLLTDLKPGHRSWLYDAMQEVKPAVFCTSHKLFWGLLLLSHPSPLYHYLPFLLACYPNILMIVNAKILPLSWLDVDILFACWHSCCVSAGSPQKPTELHSGGSLCVTVCASKNIGGAP